MAVAVAIMVVVACSERVNLDIETTRNREGVRDELMIWWEQGFNPEEDRAILNLVDDWQKQTGNQVKLSFFSTDELTAKTKRAMVMGNLPDLMMNPQGDRLLYPQLAWQNKLEDVSDIIEPIADDYPANILRAITYYNSSLTRRGYYAIPIDQITILIFYWQNLLASVGLNSEDIPQDWEGFWQFWQQAQTKLKTEQNLDIYALGLPLGDSNSIDDTYFLFEQILEAYDISLFNHKGELTLNLPEVRQGIIKCLNWYSQMYQQGYIPTDALQWTDTDNNRSLLNRQVLMTPNTTFSIPATVSQDKNVYYNQLGVLEFPDKLNGEPIRPLVAVRQAVIFKDSTHISLAKNFLSYYIQPQTAIAYLKAANSRTQPVRTSVWSDAFWQNTQDPYIANGKKVLTSNQTRLYYSVEHPAYSQVLAENIWGKALHQVTADKINPELAADWAIARIKAIFAEWNRELTVNKLSNIDIA